jgi:hypothetical protein
MVPRKTGKAAVLCRQKRARLHKKLPKKSKHSHEQVRIKFNKPQASMEQGEELSHWQGGRISSKGYTKILLSKAPNNKSKVPPKNKRGESLMSRRM